MHLLRFAVAAWIALGAWATGIALAVDKLQSAAPDGQIGAPAFALGVGIVMGAVALRPARSRVVPIVGVLLGLLLAMYASWLLDPTPATIPERSNLLFALGLAGIWFAVMALRLRPGRRFGLLAAGLLLAGLVAAIAGYGSDSVTLATTVPIGAVAAGLACVVVWAATAARWLALRRPLETPVDGSGQMAALEQRGVAWQWSRPLPVGVSRLAFLAGYAALVGGLVQLIPGSTTTSAASEIVELVYGVTYALFIVRLVRSAPRIGEVTSPLLAIVELAMPLGLLAPALLGGITVAALSPTSDQLNSAQLTSAGLGLVGISVARLGWIVRKGPRLRGVLAGLMMFLGGFAGFGGTADFSPDVYPLVHSTGRAVLTVGWLLGGLWLVGLGRRFAGSIPLDLFRVPNGLLAVSDARPGRTRSRAGRRSRKPVVGPARPTRWARTRTESRHDVHELARRLGVTAEELRSFQPAYATFTIAKRSGGRRTITAPDTRTKAIQRRILHRLLAKLAAHDAAHGFELGRSIVTNAALHPAPAVLVKLDVEEFFAQTRTARIRRFWRILGWDREAARVLTRLTTHDGGLPQGAPTSPRLSNLANVRLDARLAGLAVIHGATYSRYADDMTFSFGTDNGAEVRQLIHAVRRICWSEGRYRLHLKRKVEIRRRHERQEITGLVVNDGPPRLSRSRRRWLRAVEYRRYSGGAPTIDDAALRGWQAFEAMIESQAVQLAVPPESMA
jgi:RNA-directed DNA polymerase